MNAKYGQIAMECSRNIRVEIIKVILRKLWNDSKAVGNVSPFVALLIITFYLCSGTCYLPGLRTS